MLTVAAATVSMFLSGQYHAYAASAAKAYHPPPRIALYASID